MEALAPLHWLADSAPEPLWKVIHSSQAKVLRESVGLGSETLAPLNPSRAFARSTVKRSVSKQPARTKRGARAHGQSILIIDDVSDVSEMIALFLKHAGFDVSTANSAEDALHLTAQCHFDLIISDIGMPQMNGYEFAESLRNRGDYRDTPLIAVTGYTEYDDRGRSLRAGFNAHLTKPINPSHLLELICELLD